MGTALVRPGLVTKQGPGQIRVQDLGSHSAERRSWAVSGAVRGLLGPEVSDSQPRREASTRRTLPLPRGLHPSELLSPTRTSCLAPPTMISDLAPLKNLYPFSKGPSASSTYKT